MVRVDVQAGLRGGDWWEVVAAVCWLACLRESWMFRGSRGRGRALGWGVALRIVIILGCKNISGDFANSTLRNFDCCLVQLLHLLSILFYRAYPNNNDFKY